jgi:ABC-type transport system substrate-binding protein
MIRDVIPAGALKRIAVLVAALLGAAGLATGGAVTLGWHRTPLREVEIGALATPLTTDPTATDDAAVAAYTVGTVYPTVGQIATTTADGSGYTVRLRRDAPVTADEVTQSLTHSHTSGSPLVKAALASVDAVSTVDAGMVHIALSYPDNNLAAALAGPAGTVVVPGAGPYRIAQFAPGRSLTLARVRGSGPATVQWHFYGDAESLHADLAAGKLDLVAPAVDVNLPPGARRVEGSTGPAITVAINPSHQGDQKLADAVKAAADPVPAAIAIPDKPGQAPLVLRTTNEPDVVAAAQTVQRQLVASGIAVKVLTAPADIWRQLVDAGSYDLAVGTGLDGQQVGIVHYALIATSKVTALPRLQAGGALDLTTLRVH